MKKQLFFSFSFTAILLLNCQKLSVLTTTQNSDLIIKTGTSFGFCVGECVKELTINSSQMSFVVQKREARGSNSNLEISRSCSNIFSADDWNKLSQLIDYQAFSKIDERIGCPDCADGGAEFVEIQNGNLNHRVTFEFGKDVKEFPELLKILREKRTAFDASCK